MYKMLVSRFLDCFIRRKKNEVSKHFKILKSHRCCILSICCSCHYQRFFLTSPQGHGGPEYQVQWSLPSGVFFSRTVTRMGRFSSNKAKRDKMQHCWHRNPSRCAPPLPIQIGTKHLFRLRTVPKKKMSSVATAIYRSSRLIIP